MWIFNNKLNLGRQRREEFTVGTSLYGDLKKVVLMHKTKVKTSNMVNRILPTNVESNKD